MKLNRIASFIILAASAPLALAHGPQTQISRDAGTGKIVTRQMIDTTLYHDGAPNLTPLTRVYVMPMLPISPTTLVTPTTPYESRPDQSVNGSGLYNYGGPGISYQYDASAGGNLAGTNWTHSGSTVLPDLSGTTFTYKLLSGLESWNGSSFVDPGTEQLQVFRGSGASLVSQTTVDSGPFGQLDFAATSTTYSANPHATVRFQLLGDGASAASFSDDGVYRLKLQLTSTAEGVNASDPFFYVFSKNASASALGAAVDSLGFAPSLVQNAVPEPASLALIGISALAMLRRRRSN